MSKATPARYVHLLRHGVCRRGPWQGRSLTALGAWLVLSTAQAQTPPASAASAAGVSEAAKRQADSPFRWILINSAPSAAAKAPVAATTSDGKARALDKTAPPAPTARPAVQTAKDAAPAPASAAPMAAAAPPRPEPTALVATPVMATPLSAAEPVVLAKRDDKREEPSRIAAANGLVVLSQAAPQLPSRVSRDMVVAESIKVKFIVMPDGSVSNPLVTASTNRRMNGYVLTAVEQWKYAPIVEARQHEVEFAFKPE